MPDSIKDAGRAELRALERSDPEATLGAVGEAPIYSLKGQRARPCKYTAR